MKYHKQLVLVFIRLIFVFSIQSSFGTPDNLFLSNLNHSRENGCIETFNTKMRDELLSREAFYSLKETEILIEQWQVEYNTFRTHGVLGFRFPETDLPQLYVP